MANNNSARNVQYDPLPLTSDDPQSRGLYNASPDPHLSTYHTPQTAPSELGMDESAMPPGAAPPRFLGTALYDGPGSPSFRDSFASSQHTIPASEYGSSVYALNDPTGQGRFDGSYRDNPQDGYYTPEHGGVPMSTMPPSSRTLEEKRAAYAPPKTKSRRKLMIIAVIVCILLVIIAVIIPVYMFVVKPSKTNNQASVNLPSSSVSSSTKTRSSTSAEPSATAKPVTGGDQSIITMEDGTTFIYRNPFGGRWYYDENDPFNNGAQAQSWTPALNETFNYGVDKIRGVNFGGWLVTEPFIAPALYEKYLTSSTVAVDEWTLCQNMAADTAGGGLSQLETHYRTFITEKDFADVAGAGLNYIRIPIGFWAVEVRDDEPYLPKVSWTYFLKAIKWARKYGLRINLDLHALPGSQNGWNHSGRLGTIGFLNGPMGYANAQRSLDYIRILAEFISQPQYRDVVTMFGFMNEPQASIIGKDALTRFYYQAYSVIRAAGGTGAGNGPYVSMHDAFLPRSQWANVFPNADRLSLDSHPYLCFSTQSTKPILDFASTACSNWGGPVNDTTAVFGLLNAGEFSNAINDCGKYLNGVNLGTRYEGTYEFDGPWPRLGDCEQWTDYQSYTPQRKADLMKFALSSMDALQDYFFWTWKIGNSSVSGKVESPAWSYQLGLTEGWMPKDPRQATGACGNTNPWTPPLAAWQTGGAGAGNIPASVTSAVAWPPASLSTGGAVSTLPSYTPTGSLVTLPVPTFTGVASTVNAGNGWSNPADNTPMMVPIVGCTYLDPWVNPSTAPPAQCPAPARRRGRNEMRTTSSPRS